LSWRPERPPKPKELEYTWNLVWNGGRLPRKGEERLKQFFEETEAMTENVDAAASDLVKKQQLILEEEPSGQKRKRAQPGAQVRARA